MSKLTTAPNLTRHDDLYDRLIEMHQGLSEAECRRLDARLILILINHIGDEEVIAEAIGHAQRSGKRPVGS